MSELRRGGTEAFEATSAPSSATAPDSPPVLPVATIQRLAFIRYLHNVGAEQSRQPEPLAALAALSLHDAVELFLQLATEHVNANAGKRAEFADYFGVIDAQIAPSFLAQRARQCCA